MTPPAHKYNVRYGWVNRHVPSVNMWPKVHQNKILLKQRLRKAQQNRPGICDKHYKKMKSFQLKMAKSGRRMHQSIIDQDVRSGVKMPQLDASKGDISKTMIKVDSKDTKNSLLNSKFMVILFTIYR